MTKVVEKSQFHSLGLYYSNLLGRAITSYNNKTISLLNPQEYLLVVNSIKEINMPWLEPEVLVVVLLISGGALPYRIGNWVSQKDLIGSLYSLGIYKKVDYSVNPQQYCGMKVTDSPLINK